LEGMIRNFIPEITEINICQNPIEAIERVEELQPDILFLDVNMPQLTGFELVDKLKGFEGKIIFTTAYDQYALKAFEVGAFDYLLKPIEIAQLEKTVARYIEDYHEDEDSNGDISALFEAMNGTKFKKSLAVNHRGGMQFIKTENVLFLKGQGNYTEIVCGDYTYMSTKTMKDVEAILDPTVFIRVHRSYVVNIERVQRCHQVDGTWYIIINDIEIPVSRRRKFIIDQFAV
jgi:two-component system LytT family response regulator